jgi:hypothetical protein
LCYCRNHPDENIVRNYKVQERAVQDFLEEAYPEHDIEFDKQVSGGCSSKRPDAVFELFTHVIVVECDENQHHGYSCENKRMMEISQDFGYRPVVFIRFNPDRYDKNIGCFDRTVSGMLVINHDEFERRALRLKECIDSFMYPNEPPSKTLIEEFLFYNENKK